MAEDRVIVVLLRRPRKSNPEEMRSDPFWEFGSFGCTRCHARNLMNPSKGHELEGVRLAFVQGGHLGLRLVLITPPVRIVHHTGCCEARWKPAQMPFRYDSAPLVVSNEGETDFSGLIEMFADTNRTTLVGRFSSRFRSRREPLPAHVARKLLRRYEQVVRRARKGSFAASYEEALPYPPNRIDGNRASTYRQLLARLSSRKCQTQRRSRRTTARTKCHPGDAGAY
jgi:hypothetical protein